MVDNLPVILFRYAINLHRRRLVDQIEQGREGITQVNAAPAAMTNIVNAFEFGKHSRFIVKPRLILAQRIARGGL